VARWAEIEAEAPALAAAVRARFDAHIHKVLATLRRDGSPRLSGIEAQFLDGELWLGLMPGSLKAADVRRDPRLALHSATVDPPEDAARWEGDAKLSGRGVELTDETHARAVMARLHAAGGREGAEPGGLLFRVEIEEAVVTRLNAAGDRLVVESWREGRGLRRVERA